MKSKITFIIAAFGLSISVLIAAASKQTAYSIILDSPKNSSKCTSFIQQKSLSIFSADVIIIAPNGKQYNFGNHRRSNTSLSLPTIFGSPTKITDFYYEMDDMWVKKWEYPGAVFYILPDGQFDRFEIKGPGFKLNIKGAILEVGKPIDAIASAFPNYKNYLIDGKAIAFTFKIPDGELSDEFLEIDFDPISKKILWMGNGMP